MRDSADRCIAFEDEIRTKFDVHVVLSGLMDVGSLYTSTLHVAVYHFQSGLSTVV